MNYTEIELDLVRLLYLRISGSTREKDVKKEDIEQFIEKSRYSYDEVNAMPQEQLIDLLIGQLRMFE